MHLAEAAIAYRRAGLSVLPARVRQKRPALPAWKAYQSRLPGEIEIAKWFGAAEGLCLIAGAVSGNLEMLDFDLAGEAFAAWADIVRAADSVLYERLVIERSPLGGFHAVYRCHSPVCGNQKLAQRKEIVDGPAEVTIAGKNYKPRRDPAGQWHVLLTTIETRGEGGLFLCAPTSGYELIQGSFTELPVLTDAERELLLQSAWSLNAAAIPQVPVPAVEPAPPDSLSPLTPPGIDNRPGDDFNQRGDVRAVLRTRLDARQRRRQRVLASPRQDVRLDSATLKGGVFFVFSQNATPFDEGRPYAPFSVYTLLEHHGDFSTAAAALRDHGFGGDVMPAADVDLAQLTRQAHLDDMRRLVGLTAEQSVPPAAPQRDPGEPGCRDPGEIPEEMLRVPGFVSELMDLCMETAPYPNQPMTFCGALALQAFLAGRKVCDSGDNRTNLYLLGLALSSAGKDWIRKLNAKILHEIGLLPCLGDRLASGEGVQEALHLHPSMLFQSDEIDGMLQSINKSKEARHEGIMNTLLSLYSSANSVFAMRPRAGKPDPGAIDQPSLVLFGTAIPKHFYDALSERHAHQRLFRPPDRGRGRPVPGRPGAGDYPSVSQHPGDGEVVGRLSPRNGQSAKLASGAGNGRAYGTRQRAACRCAAVKRKANTPSPRSTAIRWARPCGGA